jgi:uncharacterized membrane protein
MVALALLSAARLATLAAGRGGLPTAGEWPWIAVLLALVGLVGTKFLTTVGLPRWEAIAVAVGAPLLVLVDAPLGDLAPGMSLAANLAGCATPVSVGLVALVRRRVPLLETFVLVGLGIVVAFFASRVVPDRGVLLSYRIPALVVGITAAALFRDAPAKAGVGAFAAGAIGVLVGADLLHLGELAANGGPGRVVLGGAGLLDGIFLVSILAGGLAASFAMLLRTVAAPRKAARGGAA